MVGRDRAMSSPYQTWVGSTVHRGVAVAIEQRLDPFDLDAVFGHARATINKHPFGSRRAHIVVASRIRLYLRAFLPPEPWQLRCAEMPVGRGRVDLCWVLAERLSDRLPAGLLLFDEIKVSSLAWVLKDPAVRAQATRYENDGDVDLGDRLLGTRIVALDMPAGAVLTARLQAWAPELPWLTGRSDLL